MPILNSGSTTTVTLGAYDSITLQNRSGQAASISVGGTVVNGNHSGSRTYGPYPSGGSVSLNAISGDLYYEIADGAGDTKRVFARGSALLAEDGSTVSAGGSTGISAFKQRLVSMRSRRKRALWDKWRPLVAPSAWASGVIYPPGSVVESGGHWYQQVRSTVSVASTTAPTGTQYRAILDGNNGPAWQWIGPALGTSSLGYSVTYTPPQASLPAYVTGSRQISGWDSTTAQFGTVFRPWANIYARTGKGEPLSGSRRSNVGDPAAFIYLPANNGRDYYTDSSYFAIRSNGAACAAMLVDDAPVVVGNFSAGADATNLFSGANFGSRGLRKITVLWTGAPSDIYVNSNATFYAPTAGSLDDSLRGISFGDSWAMGVVDMGVLGFQGYIPAFLEAIGCEDVAVNSIGGTGVWRQNNDVTSPNYLERFRHARDVTALYTSSDPVNFFHIQGSVNDNVTASNPTGDINTAPTAAQLTAQTLTLMQEVRALWPGVTIMLSAIQSYVAVDAGTNAAYKAAFDQFAAGDSNCVWVDASATGASGEATLNSRNTPNGKSNPTSGQETHVGYFDNTTSSKMLNASHPTVQGNLLMGVSLANQLYRAVGLPLRVE